MCEDDDYWPEFGTLIVRDEGVHSQGDSKVQPCGTFVRTGHGWLEGAAGDEPQVVRIEVHDAQPVDDAAGWEDVVEIPYRSPSGTVGLGYVTGGFTGDVFSLPAAGDYRVLVTRTRARWLLRFWQAEPSPPRWLKRHEAAVSPSDPAWGSLFTHDVSDLLYVLWAAQDETGGTTAAALSEWGARHGRPAPWPSVPLTTPFPDQLDPAWVAAQAGLPVPATLAGLLDVFVALGVLAHDDGRYRTPASVPNPEDVLDLPAERGARLAAQRDLDRFRRFAADLVSVAEWHGAEQTLAGLADRTLVPEAEVRATLEWAVRTDLLRLTGSLDERFAIRARRDG